MAVNLDALSAALSAALPGLIDGVVFPCDSPASDTLTLVTRAEGVFGVMWLSAPSAPAAQTAAGIVTGRDFAADGTATLRKAAVALLSDPAALLKALRSVVCAAVDEIDAIRARLRAQDTAVANAATLAALKTAWAALAAMPDRTYAQALAVATGRVNDGSAD